MFHARGANQFVLNEEERAELRAVLLRNPALRQARDLLQNRMFNNGITLIHPNNDTDSSGGRIGNVTPAFAEILEKYYVPFARNLFDDYLAFGYSHYFLQTVIFDDGSTRRKVTVPQQLQFGTYEVRMETEPFQPTSMTFVCTTNMDIYLDLFAMAGGGGSSKRTRDGVKVTTKVEGKHQSQTRSGDGTQKCPDIFPIIFDTSILPEVTTGKHNSLISSLIRNFKHTEIMTRFTLQAEYLRANPKLITKSKDTKGGATATKDIDPDSIIDNELLQLREKQRNHQKLQSIEGMIRCQQGDARGRRVFKVDDDFIQIYDQTDNIFQLPYDVELASNSVQQATSRNDLLDFQLNNARQSLQVLGIPSALIAGRDVSLKSSAGGKFNEQDMKLFYKTLHGYKRILQAALQQPYDHIYGLNRTKNAKSSSKTRAVEIETVKGCREKARKKKSLFSKELIEIPITNDSLSPETIVLLAEHGALSEAEKRKYLLINAGLVELI